MTNDSKRLVSLDAFRGVTIVGMILVNHPGTWSHVYPPLRHAEWHGITTTDWDLFFFCLYHRDLHQLVLSRRKDSGASQAQIVAKIVRRSIVIFLLGVLLYLFPKFHLETMRIPGVLQRIALV